MATEWEEIDDDASVGFLWPCDGAAGPRDRDGCGHGGDHGHVLIGDAGLTGRVPFPCESRAGTAALLRTLRARKRIDADMEQAVLALASVRTLPPGMTENERALHDDPATLERMTDYVLRLR